MAVMQARVVESEAGFSLAELLVSSVLVLLVLGTVTPIFIQSDQVYRTQQGFLDARNSTAAAVDILSRLIRQAQVITPDPDANNVLDSIRIVADWNPRDGDTNDPYETITFSAAGGQLLKQEPGDAAPVPFADRIQSITFTYQDTNGVTHATPSTVSVDRLAFVLIRVQTTDVDNRPGIVIQTSTSVRRTE